MLMLAITPARMKSVPAAVTIQPGKASTVPKQDPHAQQHRHQCDPKRVCAVKTPVRAHHADLIRQEISAQASHDAPDQEMAEAARRPTHVAQRTIFHKVRIPNALLFAHRQDNRLRLKVKSALYQLHRANYDPGKEQK